MKLTAQDKAATAVQSVIDTFKARWLEHKKNPDAGGRTIRDDMFKAFGALEMLLKLGLIDEKLYDGALDDLRKLEVPARDMPKF